MRLLRRLYGIVSHNFPWKVAALFASTTLWMAINGSEPNADRYLRLPVSPFGLPGELVIANQDAWHVEVQVRGPRSILRTIDEEAHRVALDLRGVEAGPTSMKVAGSAAILEGQHNLGVFVGKHLERVEIYVAGAA